MGSARSIQGVGTPIKADETAIEELDDSTPPCDHQHHQQCPAAWTEGFVCVSHGGCRSVSQGPWPEVDCKKQCHYHQVAQVKAPARDNVNVDKGEKGEELGEKGEATHASISLSLAAFAIAVS